MMSETSSPSAKVLVAEDDYRHASALARALEAAGIRVAGPVARLDAALRLLEREADISGAVLSTELQGEAVYPVAAMLRRQGRPFVLVSGTSDTAIPTAFRHVPCLAKPVSAEGLLPLLGIRESPAPWTEVMASEEDRLAA